MGYYVVGEPIPLPIERSLNTQEYLAYFPPGTTCIFFKKREKAVRYAQFKNAESKTGICPIFELEAIPENAQTEVLKLGEETLKAKKGVPKKHKVIASATLDYIKSENPYYNKVKFEKKLLKQSFDNNASQPALSPNSVPDSSNKHDLPQSHSTITFAAILLAVVVSTLLWSTTLYYSTLPATFIQMLATWGIIFVLPSSVLMAKIWFAFSLGTLATGALMGFYYGVKYTLKLLDLLISFTISKCQNLTKKDPKDSSLIDDLEKSYLQRLSQFIGENSHNLSQKVNDIVEVKPTTFSWKAIKQKVSGLFRKTEPSIDEPAKKDQQFSPP